MQRKLKRRRKSHINRATAIKRLETFLTIAENNLRIALEAEAVLEAANDTVKSLDKVRFYGAGTYNHIKEALAANLALSIARVFDVGAKRFSPNRRDVGSLPQLIYLLRQRRCQNILANRARTWNAVLGSDRNEADCRLAIAQALQVYKSGRNSNEGKLAYARLKDFRDGTLAHSLIKDRRIRAPKYSDLYFLLKVATEVITSAKLAIEGNHTDFSVVREPSEHEASLFWPAALKAAMTAGS